MNVFSSSLEAMEYCIDTKSFAVAHLYSLEKTMNTHFHDCYEIYYSISGGKQFFIHDKPYDVNPGDAFFIDKNEKHYLSKIVSDLHERILIFIHPEFIKKYSTEHTDLQYCFSSWDRESSHRITLSDEEQKQFIYFIHRLSFARNFGQDVLDMTTFLELVVFLNRIYFQNSHPKAEVVEASGKHHDKIYSILSYINQNLAEDLSINCLAERFFISPSYLSVIFKKETGTTINKYVTAQRVAAAKVRLEEGYSVTETIELCGFRDYSNFFKIFAKSVGISPKKYAQFSSK